MTIQRAFPYNIVIQGGLICRDYFEVITRKEIRDKFDKLIRPVNYIVYNNSIYLFEDMYNSGNFFFVPDGYKVLEQFGQISCPKVYSITMEQWEEVKSLSEKVKLVEQYVNKFCTYLGSGYVFFEYRDEQLLNKQA